MSEYNPFLAEQRNSVNHMNYYYFKNAFTPEEIIKIIELGEKYPKKIATTVGQDHEDVASDYRLSEIAWMDNNEETDWIYQKVYNYGITANKEMWNFDIWGNQDPLQYTKYYGNGGNYNWHADLGPSISNRKLSCVLQLSSPEEYDGGDLQMNLGGEISNVTKDLGTLCFFPSFVLHRVTPVSLGVRKSLVLWLSGANFR